MIVRTIFILSIFDAAKKCLVCKDYLDNKELCREDQQWDVSKNPIRHPFCLFI